MNEHYGPKDFDTRLTTLRAAHRALDDRIRQLIEEGNASLLELQRLKKQKLALKDHITFIENERLPDIIA